MKPKTAQRMAAKAGRTLYFDSRWSRWVFEGFAGRPGYGITTFQLREMSPEDLQARLNALLN